MDSHATERSSPSEDAVASTSSKPTAQPCSEKTVYEIIDNNGKSILIEAPPGSLHIDEHGNTVFYEVQHQPYTPANEVIEEVVEEEICEVDIEDARNNGWDIPLAHKTPINLVRVGRGTFVKNNAAPPTVLLTAKSLKANAVLDVKAGRKGREETEELEKRTQYGSADTGELNRNLPTMKNAFKVFSQSALLKASTSSLLQDVGKVYGTDETEDVLDLEKDEDHNEDVDSEHENSLEEIDTSVTETPMMPSEGRRRETCDRQYEEWPMYWHTAIDFQEACEILIGAQSVPSEKMCRTVPKLFRDEGTFVVDIRDLRSRHEVLFDHLGNWGRPSGKVRYYMEERDGNLVRADNGRGRLLSWATHYTFKCMLKKYDHPATIDQKNGTGKFQKKIYTALLPAHRKAAVGIAIVTYAWVGGPRAELPAQLGVAYRRFANSLAPPASMKSWEEASFINSNLPLLPAAVSEYFDGCPLYANGAIDFNDAASIILGGTIVEPSKVSKSVPQGFRSCGTFVIDVKRMWTHLEIRRDSNGIWNKPAGHSRYYKIDEENGDAVRVDKAYKLPQNVEYDIQVLMKRYEHPQVNKRFVRKIYTGKGRTGAEDFPGNTFLAVVTYFWKGEPVPFNPMFKQNSIHVNKDKELEGMENDDEFIDTQQDDVETPAPASEPVSMPFAKKMKLDLNDLGTLKMNVYRKELENQERLSAILDRAESLLNRLDRNSPTTDL
ncbi:unnamed protein product [Caenorhabditis auriculariae]|uniref:Uncharacterized protein n=1 Tax=Caenorhabditis auriculariae TaxID=2777116 RepID=A0A8S1HW74_9PELO|nr:unnamed protein product [Caenorhabditis auriculariae]